MENGINISSELQKDVYKQGPSLRKERQSQVYSILEKSSSERASSIVVEISSLVEKGENNWCEEGVQKYLYLFVKSSKTGNVKAGKFAICKLAQDDYKALTDIAITSGFKSSKDLYSKILSREKEREL